MATHPRANGLSKQEFVKRVLLEDPQANVRAVNQAWTEASNAGSISPSLVAKVRSAMGLTKRATAAKPTKTVAPPPTIPELGPPSGSPAAEVRATITPRYGPDPSQHLDELERDLDRILFRVMDLGDLPEVEAQIRRCRRLLILGGAR